MPLSNNEITIRSSRLVANLFRSKSDIDNQDVLMILERAAHMVEGMYGNTRTDQLSEDANSPRKYRLVMNHYGTQKINVIKALRANTQTGLKQAKDMIESTGVILSGPQDRIMLIAQELKNSGASVEIQRTSELDTCGGLDYPNEFHR